MFEEQFLENKLLDTGVILNNEYLHKYIDLILPDDLDATNKNNIYDKHHIIPKCYYKHNNLPVDNSPENIVKLTVKNHIIAHFYLYKCSAVEWFKYANLCAIMFFFGRLDYFTEEQILNEVSSIESLVIEARKLNSKAHSGEKHPNYGKKLSLETRNKISKAKKGIYGSNGRIGCKLSEETKAKISAAHRGRELGPMPEEQKLKIKNGNLGKHWGKKSLEARQKMSESHKGKPLSESTKLNMSVVQSKLRWFNNGEITTKAETCPEGFVPGRLKFKKHGVEVVK